MVYLYAKKTILLDANTTVDPKVEPVFQANPATAKQLDALKSARPATKEEIDAFQKRESARDGTEFQAPAPSDPVVQQDDPAPKGRKD